MHLARKEKKKGHLVGLLRLQVAFFQLLAHVAARFQRRFAGPLRHRRVGDRLRLLGLLLL